VPKLSSVADAGAAEAKLMLAEPVENVRVLSIVPKICAAHAAWANAIHPTLRKKNCFKKILLANPETGLALIIGENEVEKHSHADRIFFLGSGRISNGTSAGTTSDNP